MFSTRQHDTRTLGWWFSRRDRIDRDPVYQRRGGIWHTREQAYLIDSIINGYDVPKLYFADFTVRDSPLNSKRLPYAVIDGKQRLEAIFAFFEAKLRLADNFSYQNDPSRRLGGLSYLDLKKNHPDVADDFEQYNLTVVSVITDDEEKINELFIRLNSGKALSGAEIRNAMAGRVPRLIRELVKHPVFTQKVGFATLRGQDKNAAAKLLLLEFRGKFVDTKKGQLDRFALASRDASGASAPSADGNDANTATSDDLPPDEGYIESQEVERFADEGKLAEHDDVERAYARVCAVLNRMADIFVDRDPLLRSQGPLVPYYWLVRNEGERYADHVREFLVRFEADRLRAREQVKAGATGVDPVLLDYNTQLRAINDQGALTQLYDILETRFLAFVAGRGA